MYNSLEVLMGGGVLNYERFECDKTGDQISVFEIWYILTQGNMDASTRLYIPQIPRSSQSYPLP